MNPGSAQIVLYDDEEIRVIWSPGSSDFVMVTFGDLITLARDDRFFADVPLKKSGIPTIGVMAKRGHWYPSGCLHKASGFIRAKIDGYKTRIAYGGSMGGYAAVKFSGLLGTSHVIALCPQWSIDPAECRGVDCGWGNYFLPAMRGMGIRAEDVAGEVFLFADALHARDMFHCRRIIENYPNTHFVNVPIVGHHVTTVFAGTGNLLHLIDACRTCDIAALRGFSRLTRKSHPIRLREILPHAIRKFPRLGIRLLVDSDHHTLLKEHWRYSPYILSHLANTVGSGRAISFYEKVWSLLPGPVEQQLICAYLVGAIGGRVAIVTTHLSWLVYNLSENRVLHKGAPLDPWEIPIEAKLLHSAAVLFVTVGGTEFRLSANDDGLVNVPAIKGQVDKDVPFNIRPGENGRFAISHNGRYLSAENPGGRVTCSRDTAQGWEMFRFGPLSTARGQRNGRDDADGALPASPPRIV
jgi:hypothetical protein